MAVGQVVAGRRAASLPQRAEVGIGTAGLHRGGMHVAPPEVETP
jgi:hypothetical protein